MAGCSFCGFRSDLGASAGHVNFSTIDTRDGVIVVFAAASKEDVTAAQALAAKAYAMMSGGAAQCEVTKAKMADKNCVGCKAGLDAFTNADVKMENTEEGARAVVVSTDKNSVAKLHAFFQNLQVSEKTDVKG
jgi:heterodisulfide reductase subunit A-like polyferredoxin